MTHVEAGNTYPSTSQPQENRTILNKFEDVAEAIFVGGKYAKGSGIKILASSLFSNDPSAKIIIGASMAILRDILPDQITLGFREQVFSQFPLQIDQHKGHRVLEVLGSGSINIVYLHNNDDGAQHSIGVNKKQFKIDQKLEAVAFAQDEQNDFHDVNSIFGHIPGLIPQEQHIVASDRNGNPRAMFIREYIAGPLRDVFKLSASKLQKIATNNPVFANQITDFISTSNTNIDFVLGQQQDILGINNLCVAGKKGSERLVLLDPHTVNRIHREDSIRKRIEERVNFLNELF